MITNLNTKMRRIAITGVLGVLGVVGLAACGTDTPTATPIPAPATATTVPTETPVPLAPDTETPTSTAVAEATATDIPATETPAETAVPTDTALVEAPTETPTSVQIEVATETPTEVPTLAPTETPTSVPTEEPTQVPVEEIIEPTATTEAVAPAGNTEITATLREWAIDMSVSEVPAGTVVFNVSNTGQFTHNLTVRDSAGNTLGATPTFASSAGVQTFEVTLEPGTYTILCSLPGHASRGQQTTLVVK